MKISITSSILAAVLLVSVGPRSAAAFTNNHRQRPHGVLPSAISPKTSSSTTTPLFPPTVPRSMVVDQAASATDISSGTSGDDEGDISIPYDAAARLEYDAWRQKFNKGDFDAVRYEAFKSNYETISVANVVAKKQAREAGEDIPQLMALNEFGDYTEAEYMKMIAEKQAEATNEKAEKKSKPTSTGNVLGKALEAAESQMQASSALEDAANALAEEEELLAKKLGLESVEELEVMLDSLEGIAADGGELETDTNIAREARIRSAYLEWCKEYKKEPDEGRYPVFANNFLVMEEYANEAGKEMTLNQYADCTEEEYKALSQKKKAAKAPSPAPAPIKSAPVVSEAKVESKPEKKESKSDSADVAAAKAADMAKKVEEASRAAAAKAEEEFKELGKKRADREAVAKKEREELEEKRKQLKEWQAKSEAERRALNEKERAERQKQQEQELANQSQAFESEAITKARAEQEREAARNAELRRINEEASQIARKQAAEWDAKQKKSSPPAAPVKAKSPAPAKVQVDLSSFMQPKAEKSGQEKAPMFDFSALNNLVPTPETPKPAAKKQISTPPAKKVESKPAVSASKDQFDMSDPVTEAFSSFFGSSKPAPKAAAVPPPTVVPKRVAAPKAAAPAFSLFKAPAPKAAPKQAPAPKAAPPAPKPASAFSFFNAPAPKPAPEPVPEPVAEKKPESNIFSMFSAPKPAPKPEPVPEPVQAPKPAPFSFFGGGSKPVSKPAPKAEPVKLPEKTGTFNLFGGSKPASAPAKQPPKIPERAGTVNLFGGNKKPAPKKETAVPNRAGTINLFGGSPKPAAGPKKVPPKIPNRPGTLSIFGSGPKPKVASAPAPAAPKAAAKPAFSLFGGGGGNKPASPSSSAIKAPPKNMPVLSRWRQNRDGSISGVVSNSKNFKPGTEITTSPVPKGATAGSIVTTGSGSKYFLK